MEKTSCSAEDRLLAALAYPYWFLALPIYLLVPRLQERSFLKVHVYQGFCLGLLILWGQVTLWTTAAIIGKFGLLGLLLYPIIKLAEWAGFFLTWYGAVGAWLGKRVEIPYVTEFVRPLLQEANNNKDNEDNKDSSEPS